MLGSSDATITSQDKFSTNTSANHVSWLHQTMLQPSECSLVSCEWWSFCCNNSIFLPFWQVVPHTLYFTTTSWVINQCKKNFQDFFNQELSHSFWISNEESIYQCWTNFWIRRAVSSCVFQYWYILNVMNQKFFIFIFPNIILVVTKCKLKDSSKE